MSTWIPFSTYDLWKMREPDDIPRQEDYCCEIGCRREAEYEGRCEFHFVLWQEEQALEKMPENEWGMIDAS